MRLNVSRFFFLFYFLNNQQYYYFSYPFDLNQKFHLKNKIEKPIKRICWEKIVNSIFTFKIARYFPDTYLNIIDIIYFKNELQKIFCHIVLCASYTQFHLETNIGQNKGTSKYLTSHFAK